MLWPIVVISASFFVITQLLRRLLRSKTFSYETTEADISSLTGHHFIGFCAGDYGPFYCSLCENGMQFGMTCDFCGVMVDTGLCLYSVSTKVPCKIIPRLSDTSLLHHWVRGNLPSTSNCAVCNEVCGIGVGLVDYYCALCHICVHADCKGSLCEKCDLGTFRSFIIPPHCVDVRKIGNRKKKQLVVDVIRVPRDLWLSWTPLFIVINPKSGGALGFQLLRKFRQFLHPVQVINIEQVKINTALRWIDFNSQINCYLLVAGGDGTLSRIFDSIGRLNRQPAVAILPIGTGNDLSRVLGWGASYSGSVDVNEICQKLVNARKAKLDIWNIDITFRRRLGVRPKNRHFIMVNYISVGVDACVTFGMQVTREGIPRAFSSRFLNKLLFLTYGTKDVLEHACAGLEKKIELTVDGKIVPLPEIEGLVFLNIPYWGAGVKPWGDSEDMPQAIDDGKLEVFAVRSSFHIGQLQIGMSHGIRIAQGSVVSLRIYGGSLPMQCDGEAWIQHLGVVEITHKGQACVLSNQCS
uniref:Diacylglycerol kinase n=1 Tax=Syphacia muris TaxID=451379 RepID=A0A0N5AD69_9BILA